MARQKAPSVPRPDNAQQKADRHHMSRRLEARCGSMPVRCSATEGWELEAELAKFCGARKGVGVQLRNEDCQIA